MGTSTTTIAGRYRLDSRLGVGGMSTVHLAFDQRLERPVAVKLLAEHLADDPAFVSRFRREALAAARLVHPNIVQVFDFGFDEAQHQHFIVMEHVPGYSCAELLRDRGRLEVGQGIEIVSQACRGLDYAHRHGVVHRDVKPGNLLVSDTEVVKLADFGIARATDQSSITQIGSVLGTAAYLAPEQARGEEAGPRADLYSLGVVAYQLLSGRLPYEASSLTELALKQQREVPPPLHRLNPGVPTPLSQAVAMALALDKRQRPVDAMAFAQTLGDGLRGIEPATTAFAGNHAPEAPTSHVPAAGATNVLPRTAQTQLAGQRQATTVTRYDRSPQQPRRWEPPPRQRRRGRGLARVFLLLLLLAVVIVVAAIVAVALTSNGSNSALQIRHVFAHDAQQAINQVRNLINGYSK